MIAPRFAILFWYYKQPEVCLDRAKLLRRLNPRIPIFGLFGGEPAEFPAYQQRLAGCLDDNWACQSRDVEWKWRHGDRMICEWFVQHGHAHAWDTLIIMQWDMLALGSIHDLFGQLRRDELYLPGLRPLAEIEANWWWTRAGTEVHADYLDFKAWIAGPVGYRGELQACQFVSAALPREFLHRYAGIERPELGFLEYKIPTYAAAFGFAMRDLPHLKTTWKGETPAGRRITLTTAKTDIPAATIAAELLTVGGARLFHPVTRRFPDSRCGAFAWALGQGSAIVLNKVTRKLTRFAAARKKT